MASLAAGMLAALASGFAGAGALEKSLAGGLQISAAPALLGPITEEGRKGWACKPERAASAPKAADAALPGPDTP